MIPVLLHCAGRMEEGEEGGNAAFPHIVQPHTHTQAQTYNVAQNMMDRLN